jgi:hypothetical protein
MYIQPPAVLLEGASGSGKTSALTTFAKKGIETFVLCTEPGGAESLVDWAQKTSVPLDKLHWTTVLPATQGWSGLQDMVTRISAMDFEALSKIKSGIGKEHTRPAAMKLLETIQNFRCDRTGESYGDVTTWGADRAFCLDSLSGLSIIAWALTVGHKPTAHMGEWNIAMNFISDILMKLTSDRKCFFVLTAHVEKEMNEITGVTQIMASTLGRKLAPKIPRFFSEVVYAQRSKTDPKFRWSTIDDSADLKNRALPVSDKLPPDFGPVVDAYHNRLKAMDASVPQVSTVPSAAQSQLKL